MPSLDRTGAPGPVGGTRQRRPGRVAGREKPCRFAPVSGATSRICVGSCCWCCSPVSPSRRSPTCPRRPRTAAPIGSENSCGASPGQESGWDWTTPAIARRARYGRYQVMPANWPSWAARYLGDRWADPVAAQPGAGGARQDHRPVPLAGLMAAGRLLVADRRHGDRRDAAGRTLARGYVDNVMALAQRAPKGGDPVPPDAADGRSAGRAR